MIRPATLADRDSIFDILILETTRYPLKPDLQKVRKGITDAISSARHFAWVATDERDRACGVLIGLTGGNLWAQRSNCNVVAWVSRAAGLGASLLREFTNWVKSRRDIRVAGMCPDLDDIDPRVWLLAERIGFQRHGGAFLLYN